MQGATLPGIQVQLSGNTFRLTETGPGGQVSFSLLQPGTYRLRFTGDAVTTFEHTASGALAATIDPLGAITRFTSDDAGVAVSVGDGTRWSGIPRPSGRTSGTTLPVGMVTSRSNVVTASPVKRSR